MKQARSVVRTAIAAQAGFLQDCLEAAMKHPVHESEVVAQVWYEGTDRAISGKALCDAQGKSKVGFGLLELSPGCNTKPGH